MLTGRDVEVDARGVEEVVVEEECESERGGGMEEVAEDVVLKRWFLSGRTCGAEEKPRSPRYLTWMSTLRRGVFVKTSWARPFARRLIVVNILLWWLLMPGCCGR